MLFAFGQSNDQKDVKGSLLEGQSGHYMYVYLCKSIVKFPLYSIYIIFSFEKKVKRGRNWGKQSFKICFHFFIPCSWRQARLEVDSLFGEVSKIGLFITTCVKPEALHCPGDSYKTLKPDCRDSVSCLGHSWWAWLVRDMLTKLLDFGSGEEQNKGKRGREKCFLAMYKLEAPCFN